MNANATLANVLAVEAILRDGKIVAMIVDEDFADAGADDSYAVFNSKTAKDNDGTKAYKLGGIADGKTFSDVLSTKQLASLSDAANEGVRMYKIEYNADGHISKAENAATAADDYVTFNAAAAASKGDGYILNSATKQAIASNALWLKADMKSGDVKVDEYATYNGKVVSGEEVFLYETDDDSDGYDIVIVQKNYSGAPATPGSGSTTVDWTSGSGVTANITTNVDAADVVQVTFDGAVLANPAEYLALNNSVRLQATYLQGKALGAHTVIITHTDGDVTVTINIL